VSISSAACCDCASASAATDTVLPASRIVLKRATASSRIEVKAFESSAEKRSLAPGCFASFEGGSIASPITRWSVVRRSQLEGL
jgi:hypothetical protein